jgi:putative hydrolase of the HAD superfamily
MARAILHSEFAVYAAYGKVAETPSLPASERIVPRVNSLDGTLRKIETMRMQEGSLSAERLTGSPNISAVILDYGQVLVRCPTEEEFGCMAEMFNVGFELFFELWEASRDPYDRGDLTAEEYWLKLAAQTNSSIDHRQIEVLRNIEVDIWAHPNPGMFEWVSQLYAAGIKTGLLSNMPWDLVNHVRTNCKWMENFTFKTLSAEVRLIKPDPAIYEHTLHGLGVSAAETLFVDDREPNIRAGRALGMQAIRFESTAQLRDDLEALGFPILPSGEESHSNAADRPDPVSKFSPLL